MKESWGGEDKRKHKRGTERPPDKWKYRFRLLLVILILQWYGIFFHFKEWSHYLVLLCNDFTYFLKHLAGTREDSGGSLTEEQCLTYLFSIQKQEGSSVLGFNFFAMQSLYGCHAVICLWERCLRGKEGNFYLSEIA